MVVTGSMSHSFMKIALHCSSGTVLQEGVTVVAQEMIVLECTVDCTFKNSVEDEI